MELLTTSILTLLALYVIYFEPFKLPLIVKKNKKIFYGLIIGLYLYYYQNNDVEGAGDDGTKLLLPIMFIVCMLLIPFISNFYRPIKDTPHKWRQFKKMSVSEDATPS